VGLRKCWSVGEVKSNTELSRSSGVSDFPANHLLSSSKKGILFESICVRVCSEVQTDTPESLIHLRGGTWIG